MRDNLTTCRKRFSSWTAAAVLLLTLAVPVTEVPGVSSAAAGERQKRSPHGEVREGYGERRAVSNAAEARKVIRDYYGRDVGIGEVREQPYYYEADIRDRRGALIDRVIVDKRTGRIRSTY